MATVYVFPGTFPGAGSADTRRDRATPAARSVHAVRARGNAHAPVTARGAVSAAHHPGVSTEAKASAPLRLTRRGRAVVRALVLLVLAVVVALAVLLISRPAVAGTGARSVPVTYHVVLPGETLYGIVGAQMPGVDVRDGVAEVVELNALPGSSVRAGQRLALPIRS